MRLRYKILLASLFVLGALYIIARITGIFQFYRVSSTSGEPNLTVGSYFLASNLIDPKRYDFICFEMKLQNLRNEVWIHRLCGFPGDTVEFRAGDLYLNGQLADEPFELLHAYMVDNSTANKMMRDGLLVEDLNNYPSFNPDSVRVNVNPSDLTDEYPATRLLDTLPTRPIEILWGEPWNANYFGPVVVPQKHVFVLGDNRDNAADSRFTGFVPQENIIGVKW